MLLRGGYRRLSYGLALLSLLLVNVFLARLIVRADTMLPAVVSVTPSNNSRDVPLRTYPVVVFNKPVNPSTLAGFVNGVPVVPLQAAFDGLNQTLKIDLGDMEYQKTYTVVITGSLEDTSGNKMGNDYMFSFTTATGVSKRPTSTINVPANLQPGKSYTLTGKATGYIWQKDANNPLELRHWTQSGVDTGDRPMLHPTVLYFPNGENGYKFYLIYTPYPPDSDENPCLMRSNDGVSFTNAGVTNPLFTYNTQPIYDSQNLADPEAIKVGNTSMIFYEMEQTNYGHIAVAFSANGVNYTPYGGTYSPEKPTFPFPSNGNPIIHFSNDTWYEVDTDPTDNYPRLGEPAVIFKDNTFHIWYGSANTDSSEAAVYANASDPRGQWTKLGPVLDHLGHPDVVYDPERDLYVMLYLYSGASNIATAPEPWGPWTNHLNNPIFTAQGGWEGANLYRSSLVEVGTQWYLYYSANPGSNSMIGLAREVQGIRKAEISINGGFSWTQLTVSPDGSWSYPWTPPSNGIYSIQVRTTDDWMVGDPAEAIANVGWPTQPTNPILVIVNSTKGSFGQYTGEILKAEGLNEFQMAEIGQVTQSFLASFDTVILTTMSLSTPQATMIQNYVSAGGSLIAFKPDSKLAPVFGLTPVGTTTSEGYIKVDNQTSIGKGIVTDTIQFHGTADNYNAGGASVIATIYSNSITSTPYPAVANYTYGYGGTVFFAYDLVKSTVYLRQGNPAQANMETDGEDGIRPQDLLAGGWLDVRKVSIPQADEQMRILSNAVMELTYNKKPLPRLWYFPNFEKTMFIMTGDSDHATSAQVYQELAEIEARGGKFSFYMTDWMSQANVQNWTARGTDVGWHPENLAGDYQDWYDAYTSFINTFRATYGFSPTTVRHDAVVWTGYADPAIIQEAHGIHMDFNYYHGGPWLDSEDGYRNGWMTGSGIPMRFADENGTIYDSYQANTNFPDETMAGVSDGEEAAAIAASLFNMSNNGFYSAFVGNFHPVSWSGERRNYGLALMDYARSYGIPIWNGKQLLDFIDAKNSATFENITYDGGRLMFILRLPDKADNLTVMIPYEHQGQPIRNITLNSVLKSFNTQTIKGIEYAWFAVNSIGTVQVTADYGPDTTPPQIAIVSPVNGTVLPAGTASVVITVTTNENADCRYSLTNPSFDYLTGGTDFTSGQGTLTHSFTLSGLQVNQTYDLYYKAKDAVGNINGASTHHTFSIAIDATPPVITIVSPVNGTVLPTGTTSVVITITTNENADCRYSLTNPSFDYLTGGTDFTSGQGTLTHSFTLSGLQANKTYNLYYKARDVAGNINTMSVHHTLGVAAPTTWWNSSWLYRKPVTLTENSGSALSNYQVSLNVSYVSSKMKSDFSDLRFIDSDQVMPIPYWIESYTASVSAVIWVKVPTIPVSGTKTIYMYYGNPSAVAASNGTATFDFFDDFNDGIKDTSKWVTSGTVTETGGYLQVGSGADSIARQNTASYPLFSASYALRERSLVSGSSYVYIGFANSGLTRWALGPHGYQGYYTYDGREQTTAGTGQTSYAVYDIFWTASNVRYYQNGVLRATHTNPPTVSMGAYLRAYTTSVYARCDWILIHKYASAEPSSTIGPEEAQVPDTTPPEIAIVSPVNGTVLPAATASVVITITTNENADCGYSLTNPSFDYMTQGTDFTSGQGTLTHSFTFSGLQMGQTYHLYYKARDAVGNINSVSTHHTFSIAIDATPPEITIISPVNGTVLPIGTNSVVITVTTNESADCRYNLTNPSFNYLTEGTDFTSGQGTLTHSFTFSGLQMGQTYHLYYKARDAAGNINSLSTTHTFSVAADTTPPVITIVSPANGTVLSVGTTSVVITITTNENASCRYGLTNPSFDYLTEGTDFTSGQGTLQHSFMFSGLVNGQMYTLYYKAMDGSGNIDGVSAVHTFSVAVPDTTPPEITIISPANGTVLPVDTASVVVTIATNESADCRYSLTNASFDYMTEGTDFTSGQGTPTHSFTLSGLVNGQTYHLYYKAKDAAGNINSVSTTHTFSVAMDVTPPDITIVSPVNGTVLPSTTTSVVITITTNENADCRYNFTNSSFNYSTEGIDFTSGQGTLSHSFTLSGLQMGQMYHLYYKARDAAGNINAVSVHHTFSVATTPWWDTSWSYRKPVTLTENSGSTLSNYQVNLIVNYVSSKMKTDFSDLRFTDSDQVTPILYWIESYNASASASVWVKVPTIPASGTKTIYVYYGNPGATSASNGTATFDFFDDFDDGIKDTSKWVTSGTVTETGGYLQVGSGADSIARQNTANYPLLSRPYVLRHKGLVSTTGSGYAYIGFADFGITRFALTPHTYRSYYTYNGATEQYTTNSAGQTSYAVYDIFWTASNVRYYQNGVLRATHTNSPSVSMGAYLRAYTTSVYARCDWILIHKYASADPSSVIGPEEAYGVYTTLPENARAEAEGTVVVALTTLTPLGFYLVQTTAHLLLIPLAPQSAKPELRTKDEKGATA